MVLTAIAAIVLQKPLVTFPAGYYSLREVSAKLTEAGYPTNVSDECAEDLYALRITNLSGPKLQKAIASDERLTATPLGDGWKLERSIKSKTAESASLRRYLASAASQIYAVYGPTMERIRKIDVLPKEERDRLGMAAASSSGASPEDRASNHMTYLWYSNEIPFIMIAAVALSTPPSIQPIFGHANTTDMLSAVPWFSAKSSIEDIRFPGGVDSKSMGEARFREFLRNNSVVSKILLDPFTLCAEQRVTLVGDELLAPLQPEVISPGRSSFRIKVTPDQIWTKTGLSEMKTRLGAQVPSGAKSALPGRPIRVSEALLRIADANQEDLIFHVPSFTDLVYRYEDPVSVPDVIAKTDTRKVEPYWLDLNVAQRVTSVDSQTKSAAIEMPQTLSATLSDGVLVVRDELRFLDELSSSPTGLAVADNASLHGEMVKLKRLAADIQKLDIPSWKTSLFASNYLHTCNPIAFRPFAIAWVQSPMLKDITSAMAQQKSAQVRFDDLEKGTKAALLKALEECSSLNDSLPYLADARSIRQRLSRPNSPGLTIQIQRSENRMTWTLREADSLIWSAWTTGVTLE